MESKKKIEIINNCEKIANCDVALTNITEQGLYVDIFTKGNKAKGKQVFEITSRFFVSKENMLRFTYEILNAVRDYDKKFDTFGLLDELNEATGETDE